MKGGDLKEVLDKLLTLIGVKGEDTMMTEQPASTEGTSTERVVGTATDQVVKEEAPAPVTESEEMLAVEDEGVEHVAEVNMPSFAQALQSAVSAFTTKVGALSTARSGVKVAEDERVAAETQLALALAGEKGAANSVSDISQEAVSARDEVVSILQSWTP